MLAAGAGNGSHGHRLLADGTLLRRLVPGCVGEVAAPNFVTASRALLGTRPIGRSGDSPHRALAPCSPGPTTRGAALMAGPKRTLTHSGGDAWGSRKGGMSLRVAAACGIALSSNAVPALSGIACALEDIASPPAEVALSSQDAVVLMDARLPDRERSSRSAQQLLSTVRDTGAPASTPAAGCFGHWSSSSVRTVLAKRRPRAREPAAEK